MKKIGPLLVKLRSKSLFMTRLTDHSPLERETREMGVERQTFLFQATLLAAKVKKLLWRERQAEQSQTTPNERKLVRTSLMTIKLPWWKVEKLTLVFSSEKKQYQESECRCR